MAEIPSPELQDVNIQKSAENSPVAVEDEIVLENLDSPQK
jgi:hypothetical protein